MFDIFLFSGSPDCPSNVTLSVSSSSSLLVHFDEPLNHNGAVVTSYKGQYIKNTLLFCCNIITANFHSILREVTIRFI